MKRLGHAPALDGIRGIAVAIVVLHHLQVPWVHGGWLGVDLFFALSGFLITHSLLGKEERLGEFWTRRAWRLAPAMALLLAWYVAFVHRGMWLTWWLASLGQVLNVHDAASLHGPFSPEIGHLWSLSAEVQFYAVWPLVVLAVGRRHRALLGVAVALFAASTIERTVLALHHEQWNRLYYGPDVRSTALWAGCVVGLLFVGGAFDRSPGLTMAARLLAVPAFAALAWLVVLPSMNFSLSETPYRWGLTLVAVCAAVLVAAGATTSGGPLRVLLEAGPLVWLGRISFSVYLWHKPIIEALPQMSTASRVAIVVPASLVAGWLSYVVVERPLLSSAGRARLRARLATVG